MLFRSDVDGIAGLSWRLDHDRYAGLSAARVLEHRYNLGQAKPKAVTHFYLHGGWAFNEIDQDLDLLTELLVKSDMRSAQFDFAFRLRYKGLYHAGLHYRATDAVVLSLGFGNRFSYLGYSYDITTSRLGYGNGFSYGSHEIVLTYALNRPDRPTDSYGNVRFVE